jgi:hypothetical protein
MLRDEIKALTADSQSINALMIEVEVAKRWMPWVGRKIKKAAVLGQTTVYIEPKSWWRFFLWLRNRDRYNQQIAAICEGSPTS